MFWSECTHHREEWAFPAVTDLRTECLTTRPRVLWELTLWTSPRSMWPLCRGSEERSRTFFAHDQWKPASYDRPGYRSSNVWEIKWRDILFDFSVSRYNNNFKIKNKIKLTDMWTASCVEEVGEGNTSAVKSFVLGWPTVNFVATFR